MIILGIDPGIATTGYGIIEFIGSKYSMVDYGTINTSPKLSTEKRLLEIYSELSLLIQRYSPDTIAIEELFFSTNVKTCIPVAQARGVILLCVAQTKIPFKSYSPLQVKSGVTGYGKSDKKQVQYMVKQLLNLSSTPKPDDAADALALAICHSHLHKIHSLT